MVAACGYAYWLGVDHRRSGVTPDGLYIDPMYLNFGQVWEDNAFRWTVPVENQVFADIAIEAVKSSCDGLTVEPRSLVIAPGQSADLRLTLDLTYRPLADANGTRRPVKGLRVSEGSGFRESERSFSIRKFELPFAPVTKDAPGSPGWILRGTVRRAMTFNPAFVDFGELIRGQPFPSRKVDVLLDSELETLAAECDPKLATVHVKRIGDSFQLEISPANSLKLGPVAFLVTIQAISREAKQTPRIGLPVLAVITEDIRSLPSSLLLGARKLGEQVEETLLLYSATGKQFTVEAIDIDDEGTVVEAIPGFPGGGHRFRVAQRLAKAGSQAVTIRFAIRTQDDKTAVVTLPVVATYNGLRNSQP